MRAEDFSSEAPGSLVQTPEGMVAFIPAPLPPRIDPTFGLMNAVTNAASALSELSARAENLPIRPFLLIRTFSRKEAEASSRIEGTEAELDEILVHEVDPTRRPEGAKDRQEVLNYVEALGAGLERVKETPVSRRLVQELHGILMRDVRGQNKAPGEFRRVQNRIVASSVDDPIFVPPPVPYIADCFSDLENFIHSDSQLHPLIRLALIHYQFEAIHPFLDGNGRVGRLLIPLLLREWKLLDQPLLYLSAYFERNRRQYYDLLLEVSQKGDWTNWLLFFLRGIEIQAKDAAWRAKMLLDKKEEYREILQAKSATTALRLVDELIGFPVFTAPETAQRLGVSLPTVLSAIKRLETANIVEELTGYQRNRIWAANEIFKILMAETS